VQKVFTSKRGKEIRENLTQRTEIYSCMDTSFLRELAENINLSFRSHADTDKDDLVKLLEKKISHRYRGWVT
jgi:hypothetical protein